MAYVHFCVLANRGQGRMLTGDSVLLVSKQRLFLNLELLLFCWAASRLQ